MKRQNKTLAATGLCAGLAVLALTGCAANKNTPAATIGETKIPMSEATFYLRYNQASTGYYFENVFGVADVWNQDLVGNGVPYGVTFKEQVINEMRDLYLLEAHMADYNVEVTAEEEEAIAAAAKQFIADNDAAVVKAMMADEATISRVLKLQTIESKMDTAIKADVDAEVSDEEAAQKTIQYILLSTNTKKDEEGNKVDMTDEEKEEVKQQAQDLIDAISSGKSFEDAVAEWDDTKNVLTRSYGADDTLAEALRTAADTLENDGDVYAEPVEAETGWYVVQLKAAFDREATDSKKEEIVVERENALYSDMIAGWAEGLEFKVSDAWNALDFADTYNVNLPETEGAEDVVEVTEEVTEAVTEAATEEVTEAATTEAATEEVTEAATTEKETEAVTEKATETETETEKK